MKDKQFSEGLKSGIPIALGYLSVSFSFGMLAVSKGVPVLSALLTSMTNVTSAGQANGLIIMAAVGSFIELIICQIVINMRYALMSITLSQKLDERINTPGRLFIAFGITDEIFAVMVSRKERITLRFYSGLFLLPYFGWALGTFLGAFFGNVLPSNITAVLGIALYGMFIAIIIPPAKQNRSVLCCIVISAVLSTLVWFVPALKFISSGISVIICAVIASAFCAWKYPIEEDAG
ncbi:MAG: AzlC family ABC transporter permease [Clostridia bacterium]|nr:AzlC family ABC transporter permease [Clostridia bacterium]